MLAPGFCFLHNHNLPHRLKSIIHLIELSVEVFEPVVVMVEEVVAVAFDK